MDQSAIKELTLQAAVRFASEVRKYGSPHYSRAVDRAVKYIHLHLHNPITLGTVSEAAGISPYYLSRRLYSFTDRRISLFCKSELFYPDIQEVYRYDSGEVQEVYDERKGMGVSSDYSLYIGEYIIIAVVY